MKGSRRKGHLWAGEGVLIVGGGASQLQSGRGEITKTRGSVFLVASLSRLTEEREKN